jgi:hypothetical protein
MHVGATIGGRFQLEELVGTGTFGSVFRAHDGTTHDTVAVKLLHLGDLESVRRFNREARVLASLDHPHIVRYVSHGTTPSGESYLAMEWLDGETLQARLERGPLAPAEVVPFARAITDALACAHAGGIVHRDLKPANLFLPDGDPRRAKLLDFGIARWANASLAMTRTGDALGTPLFMAPEQTIGTADVDARSDLFALGSVLVSAVSGRLAFEGADPLAVMIRIAVAAPSGLDACHRIAPGFGTLVARLLAKRPSDRPADASDVLSLLDAITSDAPVRSDAVDSIAGLEPRAVVVALCAVVPGRRFDAAGPVVAREQTVPLRRLGSEMPEPVRGADQLVAEIDDRFATRTVILADGTLVTLCDERVAADVALAVRAHCPNTVVAMAMSSDERDSVIDTATALSRRVPPNADIGVCTDATTAAALSGRFRFIESGAVRWFVPNEAAR